MNTLTVGFVVALRGAGFAQAAMAVASLGIVQLVGWQRVHPAWPGGFGELLGIHLFAVSLTVGTIATLTLRFAVDIAEMNHPLCRWFAGAATLYWSIRTVLQFVYYCIAQSSNAPIHFVLFFIYGTFVLVYLCVICFAGPTRGEAAHELF